MCFAGIHTGPATPRSAAKTAISTLELLSYVIIATVATYWAREHLIAHNILQALLARDPTDLQQTTLCLAVWMAYMGCVLAVFYRSAKLLRKYVMIAFSVNLTYMELLCSLICVSLTAIECVQCGAGVGRVVSADRVGRLRSP